MQAAISKEKVLSNYLIESSKSLLIGQSEIKLNPGMKKAQNYKDIDGSYDLIIIDQPQSYAFDFNFKQKACEIEEEQKKLKEAVKEQYGDLSVIKYTDQDIEAFFNHEMCQMFQNEDFICFFDTLLKNHQITEAQYQQVLKRHPQFFKKDHDNKPLEAMDLNLWKKLALDHLNASGILLICFASSYMPFENGFFIENFLMKNFDVQEINLDASTKLIEIKKI